MSNPVVGIITVLFCCAGYWLSYVKFLQRKTYFSLSLIVLCGLALRLFAGMDFFLHVWDERYHALVAKHLLQHPLVPTLYETPLLPYDYREWCANHIWVHKQPFPLWTIAMSFAVFGVNEIALRLPSIILSTAGIILMFYIGTFLFNKKVGYLSALLFSIHGLIIELTSGRIATDHIDVFFMVLIESAIFFSLLFIRTKNQWWNCLTGIATGLAVLSKWLPAYIILPVWGLLVLHFGKFEKKEIIKGLLIIITSSVIVFLPWQLYIFKTFPLEAKAVQLHNLRHITEALDGHSGTLFYHFNKLRINYGEIVYLPILWFSAQLFKKPLSLKFLSVFTWFIVPYLFFSFCATKMQGYTLFAAPAVFLMISVFFLHAYKNRSIIKNKWLRMTILVLLIILPVRFTLERIKPFQKTERSPVWVQNLKILNKKFSSEKVVLFNTKKEIEAMFYTDFTAYSKYPTEEEIRFLDKKGIKILICTDEIRQIFEELIVK